MRIGLANPRVRRGRLRLLLGLTAIFLSVAVPNVESAAAEETAGIVFLAKKTNESSVALWGAQADGSSPFFIASGSASGGQISDPALSPDGREVAVAHGNNIGVINVETGELTSVYTGPTKDNPKAEQPQWSPTGGRLIFVADMSAASQAALEGNVYSVGKSGGGLKELNFPLDFGQTRIRNISFSPNGRRVVYVSYNNQAKEGRIYTARLDGGDRKFIYADPAGWSAVTGLRDTIYSPDGTSILFRRRGDPLEHAVHRIPANGGEDLQLTDEEVDPGSNDGGTWLPNGSKIAYTNFDYRNEDPKEELHVKLMDADGENPERLLDG